MAKEHILHRSERIRTLKGLLKEKRIIYLSAFFYSGKTVLLDQLATALASPVKRFDAEKDDWKAFEDAVRSELKCTLLIDSLQAMTDPKVLDALSNYLSNLPKAQTAVLAGRAQLPPALETLCATGDIHILGKDFVLFDEEEICQLFLDYGLELKPSDIAFFSESTWGWPVMMHNVANRLLKDPSRPVRAMREDVLREFWDILIRDVFLSFPEQARLLRPGDDERHCAKVLYAPARREYLLLCSLRARRPLSQNADDLRSGIHQQPVPPRGALL